MKKVQVLIGTQLLKGRAVGVGVSLVQILLDLLCQMLLHGISCGLQVFTAAAVTVILRELRKTDKTDIIMLYSGTMQGICAIIMCLALPGGFVAPRHAWQVAMMLLLGRFQIAQLC